MPHFQVRLLGSPVIETNGKTIQVDTRKAIALLVYLAVAGDQQPRDILATLLWPDLDQAHSRSALRRTLSALKRSLGGQGLQISRELIGLDTTAGWWIDLREFESHGSNCSNHNHSTEDCRKCIDHLSAAVDLVRGEFLAGFTLRDSSTFDDWQSMQSEELRQKYTFALENLAACHTYLGEFEQAINFTRRSQSIDPLNENAARELMKLYTWSGRRDAGLRQYHDLRRILDSELHVIPSLETTQLYTEILENNLIPPHIPRAQSQVRSDRDFFSSPLTFPLVGRLKEWDQLLAFYTYTKSARAFAAIEGEIGVGKTRFAEEFLAFASRNNSVVIRARCFEGEVNLPYGPFVEGLRAALDQPGLTADLSALPELWLVEIARLLPELAPVPLRQNLVPLPESTASQGRLFEAMDRLIQWLCQGPNPGILFLDDLQWADNASKDLLAYILRKSSGHPLFILATWRREDVRPGHRLRNILVEAQRSGRGRLLSLDRLNQAEVFELIQSVADKQISPAIMDRLYRESEGLPYFLVEYLSVLDLTQSAAITSQVPIPVNVRELLDSRLSQVSSQASELLSNAAVIGRSFGFDTLRKASLLSEEVTILSLEELLARGFIQGMVGRGEDSEITYDFTHEKLRSLVYEGISLPRRRVIHARIAKALLDQSPDADPSSFAGQIAFHFRNAGEFSHAARYYCLAGEYAR
ncbi:MAG TPA: AAA family ATPase, partial [Anaerolineales bacterium]|nr:AAA family ATPase [Anaerolineales bacterium]